MSRKKGLTIAQEDRIKKQEELSSALEARVDSLTALVSELGARLESHVCDNNISGIPVRSASTPKPKSKVKESTVISADFPECKLNSSLEAVTYAQVAIGPKPQIPSPVISKEDTQEALQNISKKIYKKIKEIKRREKLA